MEKKICNVHQIRLKKKYKKGHGLVAYCPQCEPEMAKGMGTQFKEG